MAIREGRKLRRSGEVAALDILIECAEALLERIREALVVPAGEADEGAGRDRDERGVAEQALIGAVAMADPQLVGALALPGQRVLRARDLEAQAVLATRCHLRDPQRPARAAPEVQQHAAVVF